MIDIGCLLRTAVQGQAHDRLFTGHSSKYPVNMLMSQDLVGTLYWWTDYDQSNPSSTGTLIMPCFHISIFLFSFKVNFKMYLFNKGIRVILKEVILMLPFLKYLRSWKHGPTCTVVTTKLSYQCQYTRILPIPKHFDHAQTTDYLLHQIRSEKCHAWIEYISATEYILCNIHIYVTYIQQYHHMNYTCWAWLYLTT